MTDDDELYHVLIYAKKADTQHKFYGQLDVDEIAYWEVSGKARKTKKGCRIFFHDGNVIYGEGMVMDLEPGKIWFTPLESVRLEHPQMPNKPHQGFKYISKLPTKTIKHLPEEIESKLRN